MSRRPAASPAVRVTPREPWGLFGLAALMLTAALLPCVVSFSPQVWFDVDPRSPQSQAPITTLGPAPQAWYHACVVALAAACLAYHIAQGGRIRWPSSVLVLVGMAFTAWHMPAGFEGLLRGSAWIAAAALALAALHLTTHAPVRRLIAAAVVAVLIPMALDAFQYVWIEHPLTVDMFRQNEAQFLAARGWSEGSPQHLLYVRRLEFPDATGPFGLSNILGSVLAACSVAALVGAWSRRWDWLGLILCGLCAGCGITALYLTHSKGAAGAFAIGVLVIAVAFTRMRRWLPVVVVLAVLVPLVAVAARASLGLPDDHTGERSLLFRGQYAVAASRIIAEHPWVGVGPGGFKDAYLQAKDPFNPEDVTSAHSMFIDWIAMLGVGGWVWSALIMMWVVSASRGVRAAEARGSPALQLTLTSGATLAMLAVAAGLFGAQYVLELPQWVFETAVIWMAGVLAFTGIAAVLAVTPGEVWPRVALLGAAVVLVVQGQIEMTFFQASSAITAWCLVAAAAAGQVADTKPARQRARLDWAMPGVLVIVAVVLTVGVAGPITEHQRHLAKAATLMRARGGELAALTSLEAAGRAVPSDATPWQWRAQLLLEQAATQRDPQAALMRIDTAASVLRDALAAGQTDLSLTRMLGQVIRYRATLTGQAADYAQATALMQEVVARNPHGLQDRLALADLWWTTGNHAQAVSEYQRILVLHDQAYLDPFRQLSDADLALVRQRMGGASP